MKEAKVQPILSSINLRSPKKCGTQIRFALMACVAMHFTGCANFSTNQSHRVAPVRSTLTPNSTDSGLALDEMVSSETTLPLLLGDGKDVISTNTVNAILKVTRAFLSESAKPWMFWCEANRNKTDAFRVWVYLSPQESSSRVIRGETFLCLGNSLPEYWDKSSPKFDGWYSCDIKPCQFAFVVSPDANPTDPIPTERPFGVSGNLSDSDLLQIVDAVHVTTPNWRLQSIAAKDDHGIEASIGRSTRGLSIYFERVDNSWVETRRMKWRE